MPGVNASRPVLLRSRTHPLSRHLEGHFVGFKEAAGRGDALVGDVEGSAVVDGSADDVEAEGDVDAAMEVEELHGNVALVVVHADDGVELALDGLEEDRVGRMGAGGGDALLLCVLDGGRDFIDFLTAEGAALAGMRVEAGHGDPGIRLHAAQRLMGEADDLENVGPCRAVDGILHGAVRVDVCDGQFFGRQHHRVVALAADLGDQLRMAGEAGIGQADRLLVDRQCHHGIECPGQAELGRPDDVGAGGGSDLFRNGAWYHIGIFEKAEVKYVEPLRLILGNGLDGLDGDAVLELAVAVRQDGCVADHNEIADQQILPVGVEDDFGTDAVAVAHRDCDHGGTSSNRSGEKSGR